MADRATNIKVVEHLGEVLAQALEGTANYFDPGRYTEYFERFAVALKGLKSAGDQYSVVPLRDLPKSSGTSDFQHRGYFLRSHLERLQEDVALTLSLSAIGAKDRNEALPSDAKKVFVVHGRNDKAARAMFEFLESLGLAPIEWSEAIKMTGKGFPYVGEVLDVAFSHAQAIVVVFTGDDNAELDPRLLGEDKSEGTRRQPRPNVLFEAGMALGRHPDRTIIVEVGPVSSFSDIHGRHSVRMNGSRARRGDLIDRLRTAGCKLPEELDGKWEKKGDFAGAVLEDLANAAKASTESASQHFLDDYLNKIVLIEDSTIRNGEFRVEAVGKWDFTLRKLSNDTSYTIALTEIDRHQVVAGRLILFMKNSWGEYQVEERMKVGTATVSRGDAVPNISKEARELISAAKNDRVGAVMVLGSLGGTRVVTNGNDFVESDDPRVEARWRAAVEELAGLGMVEDRAGKGEVFFVTAAGFRFADSLERR